MAYQNFTQEQLKNEVWKDIPNLAGRYQVSNLGRIKGLIKCRRFKHPRILKPNLGGKGYNYVMISHNPKRIISTAIHRLVMLAFIGERPERYCVNHKNGIKTDNRLENLEYVTQAKNVQHAFETGLIQARKGEKCPNAKLNESDVKIIREELLKNISYQNIARRFSVSPTAIRDIKQGRTWKHLFR